MVELALHFWNVITHLDVHLAEWARDMGGWLYVALFIVIFCETGLVVTLADSGAAVSTHHHGTSVQVVQDCDHHLTLLSAQEEVLALVTSWLVRVRDVLSQ